MGSVTSALTRTRNALVKVGSEPENHDPERSHSAPESDRARKRSARFNVSSQAGRQSSRPSLSEVLSRADSDGARQGSKKKTSSDSQQKCESNRCQLEISTFRAASVQHISIPISSFGTPASLANTCSSSALTPT